jgi:hypothetical protein
MGGDPFGAAQQVKGFTVMRYLIILAALAAMWLSSPAAAAPFDDLANRLEEYDEQDVPRRTRRLAQADELDAPKDIQLLERVEQQPAPRRTRSRPAIVDANEPAKRTRTRGQLVSQPETVTPEPVPQGNYDEGGSVWDEAGGQGDFGDYGGCGDCCDGGCGWAGGCGGCCHRFYGRAEWIQWWVRGSNTPALVTTSPDNTPANVAGILPAATVLFGDERVNTQSRPGGRFTLGYWLDACNTVGLEDTFLFLGNSHDSFTASSNGSPILARPFFNTDTQLQDAILLAYPNIVTGAVTVTANSRVYGNEINLRRSLCNNGCRRVDVLAGYRFFQMNEDLTVRTNTTSIQTGSTIPVGTTFGILDSFHTRSQFNGGQLGVNAAWDNGCWGLDLLAKLAIGGMSQRVTINGTTVTTVPDTAPVTSRGGILAQNSNIGTFQRGQFSVLPEFGVNLHRRIGACWRLNVGYTLLIVTNVVRPGDQIDTRLDPNQFPPPATSGPFTFPAFAFRDSDIWLQGVNVGLEYNF